LYQKFGFWPWFLTAIMSKSVVTADKTKTTTIRRGGGNEIALPWSKYSELSEEEQIECLNVCRILTDSIYEGLDLKHEITAVNTQRLGDTVLLWERNDEYVLEETRLQRRRRFWLSVTAELDLRQEAIRAMSRSVQFNLEIMQLNSLASS
jgi:hypothetical protein